MAEYGTRLSPNFDYSIGRPWSLIYPDIDIKV